MLNVLFAADFPIEKSGIASTASSILSSGATPHYEIFSEQSLLINGRSTRHISELEASKSFSLIFSHTEYSQLPRLLAKYPNAIVHVGDWPIHHWNSVKLVQSLKGRLALLRCRWRLSKLNRDARLAFVTDEDTRGAMAYGFKNAIHLPIGVKAPSVDVAIDIDFDSICFSGNFRYAPNRDAAQKLLEFAQQQKLAHTTVLVGYYADDISEESEGNVEIHANVPSVIDFLAVRRPVYVSLIETGAGAKNKILEAIVAGCPIICTAPSLDSSIPLAPSIRKIDRPSEIETVIREWQQPDQRELLSREALALADKVRTERSWRAVAQQLSAQLPESCV